MTSLGERRSRRRNRLCCASLCPHERELGLCGGLKRASGAMTVAKARPVVRSMPNAGRRPSVPRSTATDCAGSRPEPCWAMTDRGRHLVAETSFGTGRHTSPLHLAPGTVTPAACLMYSRVLSSQFTPSRMANHPNPPVRKEPPPGSKQGERRSVGKRTFLHGGPCGSPLV